jgi:beta-barrel assembly-enhancing protease
MNAGLTYFDAKGNRFPAALILTATSVSIQYADANGEKVFANWLVERIQAMQEESFQTVVIYENQTGGFERLIFTTEASIREFKQKYRGEKFVGGVRYQLFGSTWKKYLIWSAIFCFLIFALYWWLAPAIASSLATKISKETETSLGNKMYEATIKEYEVDSVATNLMNDYFKSLNYTTTYPIHITVVQREEVNAFAIPGGQIVVFDGIIKNMKRHQQLAALLGHEVSHIELRHTLKNMASNLGRSIVLGSIFGGDGITGVLVNNADKLKSLAYSRSLETESDDNGLKLMYDQKIDVNGMKELMEILQTETKGAPESPFLSTHPVFDERIENINQQIKMLNQRLVGDSASAADSLFSRLKKGLVLGSFD